MKYDIVERYLNQKYVQGLDNLTRQENVIKELQDVVKQSQDDLKQIQERMADITSTAKKYGIALDENYDFSKE